MDLVTAVVADEHSLEVVEPDEGCARHPARAPEAGVVPALPARDL